MATTRQISRIRAKRRSSPARIVATNPIPKELVNKREWLSESLDGVTDYARSYVKVNCPSPSDLERGARPSISAEFHIGDGVSNRWYGSYGVDEYDVDDPADKNAMARYEDRQLTEIHKLRDMINEFSAAYDEAMAYRRQGYLSKSNR